MRRSVGIPGLRRLATSGVLVPAVLAASGCGGDEASERRDPFTKVEQNESASSKRASSRAAPRWEQVTTLQDFGAATQTVSIDREAVQWRLRWRCSGRRFEVSQTPAPDEGNPLGSGRCPGRGEAEAIDTGELELAVETSGRWRAVVEQQVTGPIAEPPLPAMKAEGAEIVSSGRFYPIERRGSGDVDLYRLASGRLALRLDGFETSANTDLFVWLSETEKPRTTKQALRSGHTEFAPLKSTLGNQNYLLPRNVDADSIRSIVIWCEPIRIAYTAATLR